MFRSQAGGACDCGDTNVMKESGFCYLHGPHASGESDHSHEKPGAPPDLLCVANAMMPRLILRLIQHMRQNSVSLDGFLGAVQAADKFITMLYDLSSMGAAMRQVMTHALTNPQVSGWIILIRREGKNIMIEDHQLIVDLFCLDRFIEV
jgi:E3 ubiquitin-protein ligase UBR3